MSEGGSHLSRRRLVEIGFLAYAVLAPPFAAALFARGYPELAGASFWRLVAWQAPGYLAWALVVPLVAWIAAPRRPLGRSLSGYVAAGVPIVLVHACASAAWLAWAHPSGAQPFEVRGSSWFFHRVPIDLLVYSFLGAVVYARRYGLQYAEERTRAERLESDVLAAQLDALRARLQPHFLFNALQSIAVLIKHDPDAAVRTTRDLASVLRLTLQRSGTPLVALEAEIEWLERYVAVESVRFSDRLQATFTIDAAARRCLVPDLLLQPLVENAIRHGLGPRGGGRVGVRAWVEDERLRLEVTDDGVGVPAESRDGIGLGVTRSRLEGMFPGRHVLALESRPQGTTVRIEIPARPAPSEELV